MNDVDWEKWRGAGGVFGAILGAMLVGIGRRLKRLTGGGDEEPRRRQSQNDEERIITRSEWHDLRDEVNKIKWDVANFRLDAEREFQRLQNLTGRDHERVGEMLSRIIVMEQGLDHLGEQLDRIERTNERR